MGGNRPPLGRGNPDYRAALAALSPELREAFKEASTLLGIAEDDVIHLWMVSQAKLLEAFKGALGKDMLAALQPGSEALLLMGKRLEQLVNTSREAAQSRREQHEQLRQDEQKARETLRKDQQAGLAQIRQELAKAFQWHLVTVGVAVGLTAAVCLGGMAWWHDSTEHNEQARRDQAAQAYTQSPEGMLLHNLQVTGAKLDFTVNNTDPSGVPHGLNVLVRGGTAPTAWKLRAADLDATGNAVLEFVDPTPASTRHR